MSHNLPPANRAPVVPCECGSREAYWHDIGTGKRVYACDPCARKERTWHEKGFRLDPSHTAQGPR